MRIEAGQVAVVTGAASGIGLALREPRRCRPRGAPGVDADGVAQSIVDAVQRDVPVVSPGADGLVTSSGVLP